MFRFRLLLPCLLAFSSVVCLAQQALSNDAVMKMSKAGLGDDLIVQSINSQPGTYTTGASDLVALKQAGVSDRVIGAMLTKGTAGSGAGSAVPTSGAGSASASGVAGVDEVGVYYRDHTGKWVQMDPEIVNFKSGGALKSFATNGIIKQDKNGHLNGATAKLGVTKPTEFLLYVSEGMAPAEYQLLRLRVSGDGREFRSATGGVFHSSTGATRDDVEFTPAKIAPRMYTFLLDDKAIKGEYGILPPGAITSANAASGGKMYTFKVLE